MVLVLISNLVLEGRRVNYRAIGPLLVCKSTAEGAKTRLLLEQTDLEVHIRKIQTNEGNNARKSRTVAEQIRDCLICTEEESPEHRV